MRMSVPPKLVKCSFAILVLLFHNRPLCEVDRISPAGCGYARVSKTDSATRNLETKLHILQEFGIREEHIFSDDVTAPA